LGVPGVVLSGFVQLVTDARVFAGPTPLAEAVGFVRTLLGSPSVRLLAETHSQCERFLDLCTAADARGQRVPDAWLAALAIDHGATLMTSDRGFARYPGLRWRDPVRAR
jgi:toxin-antitoxin system PIN domain toxin